MNLWLEVSSSTCQLRNLHHGNLLQVTSPGAPCPASSKAANAACAAAPTTTPPLPQPPTSGARRGTVQEHRRQLQVKLVEEQQPRELRRLVAPVRLEARPAPSVSPFSLGAIFTVCIRTARENSVSHYSSQSERQTDSNTNTAHQVAAMSLLTVSLRANAETKSPLHQDPSACSTDGVTPQLGSYHRKMAAREHSCVQNL